MTARTLPLWMCFLCRVFCFKVYYVGYFTSKTRKHILMSLYVFVYIYIYKIDIDIYIHTYFIFLQPPAPEGFKSEGPCVYMHYKEMITD